MFLVYSNKVVYFLIHSFISLNQKKNYSMSFKKDIVYIPLSSFYTYIWEAKRENCIFDMKKAFRCD